MKLKGTKILFLVVLIVLLPITTNAIECYDVNISHTKGKTVTVTVEVVDMVRDEEIISAILSYTVNGELQSPVVPDVIVPTRDNVLNFIIGPFKNGDKIVYDVYLNFGFASCDDYI